MTKLFQIIFLEQRPRRRITKTQVKSTFILFLGIISQKSLCRFPLVGGDIFKDSASQRAEEKGTEDK